VLVRSPREASLAPRRARGRRQGTRAARGLPAAQGGGAAQAGAPSAGSQRGLGRSRLCAELGLGCLARAGGGGSRSGLVWGPCAGRGGGGRVARVTSRPCCVGVAQPAEPQLRRGLAEPGLARWLLHAARARVPSAVRGARVWVRACGGASLGQQPRPPRGASVRPRPHPMGTRARRGRLRQILPPPPLHPLAQRKRAS
jgi:hypothetical protein